MSGWCAATSAGATRRLTKAIASIKSLKVRNQVCQLLLALRLIYFLSLLLFLTLNTIDLAYHVMKSHIFLPLKSDRFPSLGIFTIQKYPFFLSHPRNICYAVECPIIIFHIKIASHPITIELFGNHQRCS